MGGLLFRSSSDRSRRKQKRGKRERLPTSEASPDDDQYQYENENENNRRISNENTLSTYEKWSQRVDQQNLPAMNVDPPGAPTTFPTNYSSIQQDIMNQSWSSGQNTNNSLYQVNPAAAGMVSNTPHDLNQFGQMSTSNVFFNQSSQPMNGERPSKKVQFAQLAQHRPLQQSAAQRQALASTQSWHESSVNMREKPAPAIITDSTLLNTPFLHQSIEALHALSLAKAPAAGAIPKPIYVGIDHRATLAERGQTVVSKRVRKSAEHSNADESHSNANSHRTRSHASNQHRHTESNDSPIIKTHVHSNRPVDPLQSRLSGTQRLGTTTTSTSTIIPNKPIVHVHQPTMGDQELRPTKTRGIGQQQSQHVEHQSLVHNELLPSRSSGSHSQQKQKQQQQQPQPTVRRHDSPSRSEAPVAKRRIEHRPSGLPVMRIPIAQHQQHRQRATAMPSTAANTTRTRV